jgi:hypothetical protein
MYPKHMARKKAERTLRIIKMYIQNEDQRLTAKDYLIDDRVDLPACSVLWMFNHLAE